MVTEHIGSNLCRNCHEYVGTHMPDGHCLFDTTIFSPMTTSEWAAYVAASGLYQYEMTCAVDYVDHYLSDADDQEREPEWDSGTN